MGTRTSRRQAVLRLSALGLGIAGMSSARSEAGATASRPLLIDEANVGTTTTALTATTKGPALRIRNPHDGRPGDAVAIAASVGAVAVPPFSPDSAAVFGFNTSATERNETAHGVLGQAVGPSSRGVEGFTDEGIGVLGRATTGTHRGKGVGVMGESDLGTGLYGNGRYGVRAFGPTAAAFASSDIGLSVLGRLIFTQSQRVKVPAGQTTFDVKGHATVGPNAFVLATAQGNGSVSVAGAHRIDDSTFRIHLSAPAPSAGLWVGYLVLG